MEASTAPQGLSDGLTPASPARPGRRSAEVALYGIYEISKLLVEPERLEVMLARVLQVLSSFLDMRHALIALHDEKGDPDVVVGTGWEGSGMRGPKPLPERAIGQIVVTGIPLVVGDMRDEPIFEGSDLSQWGATGSEIAFIGVPIKDRGKVVGSLTIDRERGVHPYVRLDEDVRFLSMVANLVGQTVRLQRLIARDRGRLMEERNRLEKTVEHTAPDVSRDVRGVVGESNAIRAVLDKVRIVARSHSTVLLRGESGTGKELFAKAVHDLSPRRTRAFVSVNCAALPEAVLESELFGHEKGAFTGAAGLRKGRFELADGGTLFLDEIGEISSSFQAKLLRVLQEGEFERVGGTTTLKVNVRLVAATNRNLEDAVSRREFRADLYYRISVVPIFLPPLRDRPEDIPPLAREFIRRFNEEHGTDLTLSDGAIGILTQCCFPGNVRELENCVRRTATLAAGTTIVCNDFACQHDECLSSVLWKEPSAASLAGFVPLPIARMPRGRADAPAGNRPASTDSLARGLARAPEDAPDSAATEATVSLETDTSERGRLIQAMESAGWVQAKAARLLGITARQIGYALRKYDIPIKKF